MGGRADQVQSSSILEPKTTRYTCLANTLPCQLRVLYAPAHKAGCAASDTYPPSTANYCITIHGSTLLTVACPMKLRDKIPHNAEDMHETVQLCYVLWFDVP